MLQGTLLKSQIMHQRNQIDWSWTSFKKIGWQQPLHSFISYIFHLWYYLRSLEYLSPLVHFWTKPRQIKKNGGSIRYGCRNIINDVQNSTWSEHCRKQLLQNVFIAAPGSRHIQQTESYRLTTPITVASHLMCLFIAKIIMMILLYSLDVGMINHVTLLGNNRGMTDFPWAMKNIIWTTTMDWPL